MVKYALRCPDGHVFEEWFPTISAYDEKREAGELSCPECGSKEISKAIMAPNVAKPSAAQPACAAAPSCGNGMCPMSQPR